MKTYRWKIIFEDYTEMVIYASKRYDAVNQAFKTTGKAVITARML